MMLNTMPKMHSDFKGMVLFNGNAITNHQISFFIRTEGRQPTEDIIDYDLKNFGNLLSSEQRELIKKRALNGTKQLVVVLRVRKTVKNRCGDKISQNKVHGVVVIDYENNHILNTWYIVNHYRSFSFVDTIAQELIAEQCSKKC